MKTKLQDRLKKQSGITLIALVVTIVVLIILAMIAVRLVIGEDGLIAKAQRVSTTQKEAEAKEVVKLALQDAVIAKKAKGTTLEEYLTTKFGAENVESTEGGFKVTYQGYEFEIGNDFKLVGDKALSSGGGQGEVEEPDEEETATLLELWESGELKIGDYVNYQNPATGTYTCTADRNGMDSRPSGATSKDESINQVFDVSNNQLNWRVLGIDSATGGLKLISGSPMRKESEYNDPYFYMGSPHAYEYGITELNNICSLYKNEYASEARSITMEDIEELLGIDESDKASLQYEYRENSYGTSFSYQDQYTPASWLNSKTKTTVSGVDNYYDIVINGDAESGDPSISLDLDNENDKTIYDILGINRFGYWIATQCVRGGSEEAEFGLFSYGVFDQFRMSPCFYSSVGRVGGWVEIDGTSDKYLAVRPVIVLSPGVTTEQISKIQTEIEEQVWTGRITEGDN